MLIFLLDIPNKNNESLFKITDLAIICGKKAIKAVSNDSLQEKKFIATKLYALYKEIVEIEQRISGRKADKCAECILKLGKIIG